MGFLYNGYILIIVLRYYNHESLTNTYLSIDSKRRRYLLYSSVLSGVLYGLKAEIVRVEVDVGNGIPSFEMSGFLSNEVKEARERVRVAIRNSGYELPPQRIVVNISPADIRKCGTGFDLPIALAILSANGYIDEVNVDNMIILGELSLDGSINGVSGVLPCVCEAKKSGISKALIPVSNYNEGRIVEKVNIIPTNSLKMAVQYINNGIIENQRQDNPEQCRTTDKQEINYADICGQEAAKRATMIAVAGMHNIMYIGPPGSGKTMMAKRIPSIMPDMTFDEKLAVTNIYSVAGQLGEYGGMIEDRPFRAPYHNVTKSSFFGGGMFPRPGEITLAGKGVLFLDEMTEFKPEILEGLRQPLEDKDITIVRMGRTYTYPADFMLVGAMNVVGQKVIQPTIRVASLIGLEGFDNKGNGVSLLRFQIAKGINTPRLISEMQHRANYYYNF